MKAIPASIIEVQIVEKMIYKALLMVGSEVSPSNPVVALGKNTRVAGAAKLPRVSSVREF